MALQDKIGREALVSKICGLVDSLKKNSNFCLAINGAWGSGKSFVLGLIEEKLAKKNEYIIIKYDAWENTFYSDPLIAILSCMIDGIEGKLSLVERYEAKTKRAVNVAANTLAKFSSKIAKLKDAIDGIKEIIKSFRNPIDTAALGEYKSYQRLLKDTKEILNAITQAGEYRERQSKLIVLVDEIDRCLPDEQLKILERLHHLFDVKNCAVIVTMNQSCVAKTVQTVYGIDGYEYLRKFFDFSYRLEISASEYLKNLLEDFKKNFEKLQLPANEVAYPVNLAYYCLLYGNQKVLSKVDNRELTRYYEGLMNICNDFGWQRMNQQYVFFVILALYIRKVLSSTFLDTDEIIDKQKGINDYYNSLSPDESKYEMPYYDYVQFFLGVDRKDPPDEFQQIYGWSGNHVAEFSWAFNEIVYYSLGQSFRYNELRRFYGQPMVKPDDCKELCKLITLYAGEQENESDER